MRSTRRGAAMDHRYWERRWAHDLTARRRWSPVPQATSVGRSPCDPALKVRMSSSAAGIKPGGRRASRQSRPGGREPGTREWAAEFGPAGVRVNGISAGVISTVGPNLDAAPEHPGEVMMRGTPAGRSGTADAVAHAAVYLASDEAAFVHGTVIDVDGGRVAVAVVAS